MHNINIIGLSEEIHLPKERVPSERCGVTLIMAFSSLPTSFADLNGGMRKQDYHCEMVIKTKLINLYWFTIEAVFIWEVWVTITRNLEMMSLQKQVM